MIRRLRVDVPGDSIPRTWTIGFDQPPRSGGEGRRRALAPTVPSDQRGMSGAAAGSSTESPQFPLRYPGERADQEPDDG